MMKRRYQIIRTAGQPDWAAAPRAQIDQLLWTPQIRITAYAQLVCGDDRLFVHLHANEDAIRAEETGPLAKPCLDSCMEFFFAFGADERYFNFEINPNGCIELGFGPDRKNRVRLCHKAERETFQPCCVRAADGWTAEYCLPLDFFRLFYPDFRLVPGVRFRGNCYKCGDRTEHPHYLAWNPVNTLSPDFHRPEFLGEMILN